MINDADWVAEVKQWYFSSQGPDRQARADEVIEASARRSAPATAPRGRVTTPVSAPRPAVAPAPSRTADLN